MSTGVGWAFHKQEVSTQETNHPPLHIYHGAKSSLWVQQQVIGPHHDNPLPDVGTQTPPPAMTASLVICPWRGKDSQFSSGHRADVLCLGKVRHFFQKVMIKSSYYSLSKKEGRPMVFMYRVH